MIARASRSLFLAQRFRALALSIASLAACGIGHHARAADDPLSGTLTIVGSDTLSTLVLRWTDAFRVAHPGVHVQMQAQGSASAPIALLEGAADIGAMSRPMSDAERNAFVRRFDYAPTRIAVAHDAIVVFVHPDNPLTSITRRQLDAIYSDTRRCGAPAPITRWNGLGVELASAGSAPAILAIGRNSASGTHEFFRHEALCDGEYQPGVVAWPGHGATVAAVAGNRNAIGYAGIGYVNGLVKPLAFALEDGAPPVAPVMENVTNGDYALSRLLYLYVNRPRGAAPAALPAAFLAFVLSDDAQALVTQEGLLPLTRDERATQTSSIRATMPES